MEIFEFTSYKDFVQAWIETRPKKGHGQFRKISAALKVSPVFVTQVFKGDKNLSPEQGLQLCRFIGLMELESEYFMVLIQKERAGTTDMKAFAEKQLKKLRAHSRELKKRVKTDFEFPEEAKAIFYSSWHYSAIRLACSIPGLQDVDSLASRLGLERSTVAQAVEFMNTYGLVRIENGLIKKGPQVTHMEATSPLVRNPQIQWRLKGLENLGKRLDEQLFYAGPIVTSKKVADEIRRNLVNLIQDNIKKVKDSEDEVLVCLNIDWFYF